MTEHEIVWLRGIIQETARASVDALEPLMGRIAYRAAEETCKRYEILAGKDLTAHILGCPTKAKVDEMLAQAKGARHVVAAGWVLMTTLAGGVAWIVSQVIDYIKK